jgi:hypothetical protein
MINEHDIKDWWLTDELDQLRKEVIAIRESEGSYADLYKGLAMIDLNLETIIRKFYDSMGNK